MYYCMNFNGFSIVRIFENKSEKHRGVACAGDLDIFCLFMGVLGDH